MPRNALQILKEADKVLASETNWVKRAFAKDKDGYTCSTKDNGAVQFCLLGAITRGFMKDGPSRDWDAYHEAEDALRKFINRGITSWNDEPERTFAEVKQVLADAIALVEGKTNA
jgi:hypothetical protein